MTSTKKPQSLGTMSRRIKAKSKRLTTVRLFPMVTMVFVVISLVIVQSPTILLFQSESMQLNTKNWDFETLQRSFQSQIQMKDQQTQTTKNATNKNHHRNHAFPRRKLNSTASEESSAKNNLGRNDSTVSSWVVHKNDTRPRRRYLTYVPSVSGGQLRLDEQLLELGIAVQLARDSGRDLLLPPVVLAQPTNISHANSTLFQRSSKVCPSVSAQQSCPDLNLDWTKKLGTSITIPWRTIIDESFLYGSVRVVSALKHRHKIFAGNNVSEIRLCNYTRCNTRWRILDGPGACVDAFEITDGSNTTTKSTSAQVDRSTDCLFHSAKNVDILTFVDLIGTFEQDRVDLTWIDVSDTVWNTLTKLFKIVNDYATGMQQYVCVRIGEDPSMGISALEANISSVFDEVQAHIQDKDNKVKVYVSAASSRAETSALNHSYCEPDRCMSVNTPRIDTSLDANDDTSQVSPSEMLVVNQMVDTVMCSRSSSVFHASNAIEDAYVSHFHRPFLGWRPNYLRKKNTESVVLQSVDQTSPTEFSACLLIKDDNHYLIEWLAYHYQVMPLRRLIVAVDPTSETSPNNILERYTSRGLMNISIWSDEDYLPSHLLEKWAKLTRPKDERLNTTLGAPLRLSISNQSRTEGDMNIPDNLSGEEESDDSTDDDDSDVDDDIVDDDSDEDRSDSGDKVSVIIHRTRQSRFISSCVAQLSRERRKWTMITDTDEYIVRNKYSLPVFSARGNRSSIADLLEDPQNSQLKGTIDGCHQMSRINVGTKKSPDGLVQRGVPNGFNGSDFMTYKFLWPQKMDLFNILPGKAIVDVSRLLGLEEGQLRSDNPHRPVDGICSESPFIVPTKSPFLTYHYAGSFEQYSYRNDARNRRTPEAYKKLEFNDWLDDSAGIWLGDFVELVGKTVADELLLGAGKVTRL